MDDPHPIFGVHSVQFPWLHTRDPFQRNSSQVHNTIEPRAVEALRQDPRGTNLGYGCSTATSREKFQQPYEVQAQLRAEFQNYGNRQEEPSVCYFTRQTGRHKTVEWEDLLLVPCQPQALPLAYTQSGGVQHLQENAQGTKQVHKRRQKGSHSG